MIKFLWIELLTEWRGLVRQIVCAIHRCFTHPLWISTYVPIFKSNLFWIKMVDSSFKNSKFTQSFVLKKEISYHPRFQRTNFLHINKNLFPQCLSCLPVPSYHPSLCIIPFHEVKSNKKMIMAETLWEGIIHSIALQLIISNHVQSWGDSKMVLKCCWIHSSM